MVPCDDICLDSNQYSKNLLQEFSQLAKIYVANEGWYVTCGVAKMLGIRLKENILGFQFYCVLTLHVDYRKVYDNGDQVHEH